MNAKRSKRVAIYLRVSTAVGENWDKAVLFGDEAAIAEKVEMHHYEVFGTD